MLLSGNRSGDVSNKNRALTLTAVKLERSGTEMSRRSADLDYSLVHTVLLVFQVSD